MSVPILTVDGPSGSGKGTLCQLAAQHLGWHLLDSGALYRLTALSALNNNVSFDDEGSLSHLARTLNVEFAPGMPGEPVRVILEGQDVTASIRTEVAGNNASKVAPLAGVRAGLLDLQRGFARSPGLVADGRDMGTVVFPQAPFKIFLTASAQARAERRFNQLKAMGESVRIAHLLEEIQERDARDSSRTNAPLKPADDAILIDSSDMSIDDVLQKVLAIVSA